MLHVSSPSGFVRELTFLKVLIWSSSLNSSCGSRLFISISMEVVMMDVLWSEFSMSGVLFNIKSTVWNVVPSCFSFISEQNILSILPFEPSPHSLGKHPGSFMIWIFMKPMVMWTLPVISPCCNLSRELTLESWNYTVKWKGVGR